MIFLSPIQFSKTSLKRAFFFFKSTNYTFSLSGYAFLIFFDIQQRKFFMNGYIRDCGEKAMCSKRSWLVYLYLRCHSNGMLITSLNEKQAVYYPRADVSLLLQMTRDKERTSLSFFSIVFKKTKNFPRLLKKNCFYSRGQKRVLQGPRGGKKYISAKAESSQGKMTIFSLNESVFQFPRLFSSFS